LIRSFTTHINNTKTIKDETLMKATMHKLRGLFALMAVPVVVAACGDDPVQPAAQLASPASVTVTVVDTITVNVNWSAVPGAATYQVMRAEGATGGTYETVNPSVTGTSLRVTNLKKQATYRFSVSAAAPGANVSQATVSSPVVLPGGDESGAKIVTITGAITANRTFHADTQYVLSGFIAVASGATLTIEPGTTIVGDYNIKGSSLFILRGARIMADGTPEKPIVFTSQRPVGQRQPGDWGGLILIGNGIINRKGSVQIEGTGSEAANPARFYDSGIDNKDNSGVLRYVRVEFAGYPTGPNQELNSFTFAAVGSGTTVDHVQALQGLDDSFEFFGGAVNTKYLVSYESGDDHFDMSEGHIGRHQFMIGFQSIQPVPRPGLSGGPSTDPQMVENDGCAGTDCDNTTQGNAQPYTTPVLANFSLVGSGAVWDPAGGGYGMMIRRGSGGLYVNGVITRTGPLKAAINFIDEPTNDRYTAGLLRFLNIYSSQTANVFATGGYSVPLAENGLELGTVNAIAAAGEQALFASIPANTLNAAGSSFNWAPAVGSPLLTGGLADFSSLPSVLAGLAAGDESPNSRIVPTSYRGAVDPAETTQWWAGWTNYARY
jgi:hypothetical protein